MHELSGSPSDGGTAHIQPARAGTAAPAAASTITVNYKDQSTKEPIPDYPECSSTKPVEAAAPYLTVD